MELTVNTFGKGLLIDTHPMVQGNETLSDALNATFITMNGNEIVLQNDMGNRRVDNAYLPPGYEPVGMKEYGGIIYVAAYNPITNKSLIGSFPSPLRKFNDEDRPTNKLDLSFIYNSSNIELDNYFGIKVIKSDSVMIPLTKDTSLHAGDKFVVYSPLFSDNYYNENIKLISNYYNTTRGKAATPKNRYFTLLLGVLNSLNEFVDITKTLLRWKKDVNTGKYYPVKYEEQSVSDVFKFNDGYFIPGAYGDILEGNTINDAKFILNRQVITANTYSYKLVGPLYLKAVYNHILNFNYNIYGVKDGNKVILWFEGVITYNCPDKGYSEGNEGFSEDYISYNETKPHMNYFNPFDLYFDGYKRNPTDDNGVYKVSFTQNKYDPKTNTYITTCTKEYHITTDKKEIEYVIGVKADPTAYVLNGNNEDVYIKGLSAKGVIDTTLLGSGTVKVNEWRFYNDTDKRLTILTFSLDAYPKYKEKFTNLRLKFRNIGDQPSRYNTLVGSTDYSIYYPDIPEDINRNPTLSSGIANIDNNTNDVYYDGGIPVYNGRQTITLDWSETGIDFRKVYAVTVFYDTIKLDGSRSTDAINDVERWILTTKLFNEFYKSDSGIKDYCTVKKENDDLEGIEGYFYSKMYIGIASSSDVEIIKDYKEEESDDNLYTLDNSKTGEYRIKHTLILKPSNNKLSIHDEELYPDFITLDENAKSEIGIVRIDKICDTELNVDDDINTIFKDNIEFVSPKNPTQTLNNEKFIEFNSDEIKITYYDILKGKTDRKIKEITNVFGNFLDKDYINSVSSNTNDGTHNYIAVTNDDEKHICVIHKMPWYELYLSLANSNNQEGFSEWLNEGNSLDRKFNQIALDVYNRFNDLLTYNSGLTLLYGLPGEIKYSNYTDRSSAERQETTITANRGFCRVWWRTNDERWALIPDLFNCKLDDYLAEGASLKTLYDINSDVKSLMKEYIYEGHNGSDPLFYSFIKNCFKTYNNLIFCIWDNYYDRDIYTIGSNHIYNNNYSIPINVIINYKSIQSNNLINIGTDPNKNYTCGNLRFDYYDTLYVVPLEVPLTLSSSENFLDKVYEIRDNQSLSNIYITEDDNIILRDSFGNLLNSNLLYIYDFINPNNTDSKKGLTKKVFKFRVDKENKTWDGKNTLVCVANKRFESKDNSNYFKSDVIDNTSSDNNSNSILDYNSASIVTFPPAQQAPSSF